MRGEARLEWQWELLILEGGTLDVILTKILCQLKWAAKPTILRKICC
jgi:hypothetical protein